MSATVPARANSGPDEGPATVRLKLSSLPKGTTHNQIKTALSAVSRVLKISGPRRYHRDYIAFATVEMNQTVDLLCQKRYNLCIGGTSVKVKLRGSKKASTNVAVACASIAPPTAANGNKESFDSQHFATVRADISFDPPPVAVRVLGADARTPKVARFDMHECPPSELKTLPSPSLIARPPTPLPSAWLPLEEGSSRRLDIGLGPVREDDHSLYSQLPNSRNEQYLEDVLGSSSLLQSISVESRYSTARNASLESKVPDTASECSSSSPNECYETCKTSFQRSFDEEKAADPPDNDLLSASSNGVGSTQMLSPCDSTLSIVDATVVRRDSKYASQYFEHLKCSELLPSRQLFEPAARGTIVRVENIPGSWTARELFDFLASTLGANSILAILVYDECDDNSQRQGFIQFDRLFMATYMCGKFKTINGGQKVTFHDSRMKSIESVRESYSGSFTAFTLDDWDATYTTDKRESLFSPAASDHTPATDVTGNPDHTIACQKAPYACAPWHQGPENLSSSYPGAMSLSIVKGTNIEELVPTPQRYPSATPVPCHPHAPQKATKLGRTKTQGLPRTVVLDIDNAPGAKTTLCRIASDYGVVDRIDVLNLEGGIERVFITFAQPICAHTAGSFLIDYPIGPCLLHVSMQ